MVVIISKYALDTTYIQNFLEKYRRWGPYPFFQEVPLIYQDVLRFKWVMGPIVVVELKG